MENVTVKGPLYDMTALHAKDSKETPVDPDLLTWQRIFTRKHPGEKYYPEWVGDLNGEVRKNGRHLFIPEEDLFIFFAHEDGFSFPHKDGKFEMLIRQTTLSEESKKDLQAQFPGKIVVVVERKKGKGTSQTLQFGGVDWSELPIVPAVLTEEDIVWEKRIDLIAKRDAASAELEKANDALVALDHPAI